MKRSIIILTGAGIIALLGTGMLLHVRQAMWQDDRRQAIWGYFAFHNGLVDGEHERLQSWVLVKERNSGLAVLRLLAGTAAVEEALRSRFGDSTIHPLPSRPLKHAVYPGPANVIALEDVKGRSVQLVRDGGGWLVDIRPLADKAPSPEDAEVMRLELIAFAQRVAAGEFASNDEAILAYRDEALWVPADEP